jgi:hypothetical protein
MGLFPCKTEMKGTTSRWGHRVEVKTAARKKRRHNDKQAVTDQRELALKSQRPAEP